MVVFEAGDLVGGGRFRLRSCIGAGGMGAVWLAEEIAVFGRKVALKFILPTVASDDEYRRRFVAEAHVVAHLDHPNICTLIGFGEDRVTGQDFTGTDVLGCAKAWGTWYFDVAQRRKPGWSPKCRKSVAERYSNMGLSNSATPFQ